MLPPELVDVQINGGMDLRLFQCGKFVHELHVVFQKITVVWVVDGSDNTLVLVMLHQSLCFRRFSHLSRTSHWSHTSH